MEFSRAKPVDQLLKTVDQFVGQNLGAQVLVSAQIADGPFLGHFEQIFEI